VTQEALCCGLPAFVTRTAGIAERFEGDLADALLIPDPDDAPRWPTASAPAGPCRIGPPGARGVLRAASGLHLGSHGGADRGDRRRAAPGRPDRTEPDPHLKRRVDSDVLSRLRPRCPALPRPATPARRPFPRRSLGLLEWFLIAQTFIPSLLFLPGIGQGTRPGPHRDVRLRADCLGGDLSVGQGPAGVAIVHAGTWLKFAAGWLLLMILTRHQLARLGAGAGDAVHRGLLAGVLGAIGPGDRHGSSAG